MDAGAGKRGEAGMSSAGEITPRVLFQPVFLSDIINLVVMSSLL